MKKGQEDFDAIPPVIARHCPDCGAKIDAEARQCWLCEAQLPKVPPVPKVAEPGEIPPRITAATNYVATFTSVILLVAIGAIGVGVSDFGWGYLLVYGLMIVPSILYFVELLGYRSPHSSPTAFSSIFLTALLLTLPIAVIVAYFQACTAGRIPIPLLNSLDR